MGVSHAASGAAGGLVLAQLAPYELGVHGPRQVLLFAAVCAGYALLPDLDHPSSLVSRRFSVASWLACRLVRPLSELTFRLTATRRDGRHGHEHRGLTHTVLIAAALGYAAVAAVARWGNPAVWTIVFVGLALTVKGLDDLIPGPPSLVAAALLTWLLTGTLPWQHTPAAPGPWLGLAVTAGMIVHCLGDALTESGCPFAAPLPLRGRTWYPIRPPRLLRIRTGGLAETVILAALTLTTLYLLTRTFPHVLPALHLAR